MLNSKKKAKLVVGVAFLLLLLVGSSAGYFLSQQSQDIRQQADDSVGGYGCEGFWDGNNCVSTEIIVPEPEEDKKGDRCSAGSCGGGLTCATSPFGNFCVPEEDAGDAEVIELNENEEDFTTFKLCKDHCEGTCEGSICVTPVKEEGEAPTDSLGYNTASECNSKCDTSCTGPNNRYCLNDDVYITENDYNECLKKSSPQDCKIILSHLGEEEPNREEEEGPKSCGGESDCPLGEICFGGSCVAESDDKEEPAPQVEELSDYEKCIASGKTGIECEYEQNNPDEGVIPTPGSLPDHLIPPKFDPDDSLSLTQDPLMRATLEAGYLDALSNCGNNEACKLAVTTSLQEAVETKDVGVALYMLENPGMSIEEARNLANKDRFNVLLLAGGSSLAGSELAEYLALSAIEAVAPYVLPAISVGNVVEDIAMQFECARGNQWACSIATATMLNPIPGVGLASSIDDLLKSGNNLLDNFSSLRRLPGADNPAGWTLGTYGGQTFDPNVEKLANFKIFSEEYGKTVGMGVNNYGESIRVAGRLGSGAFGEVRAGYNWATGTQHALKFPKDTDTLLAELDRLGEIERALSDTPYANNLFRPDGFITTSKGPAYVMELKAGATLRELNQPLTVSQLDELRGAARVRDAAGIPVHGDVFTTNIYITNEGSAILFDDFLQELIPEGLSPRHNIGSLPYENTSKYVKTGQNEDGLYETFLYTGGEKGPPTTLEGVNSLLETFPELMPVQ